jgi:hypothetical protein
MRVRSLTAAALVLTGAACLLVSTASAMPGFARRYRMSCTTCHAPFPRLKAYGEEFAGRGFRLEPGREPARATYDTGDPLLALARDIPIGMRLEGFAAYEEGADADIDFQWPWTWKIISGGPLNDWLAYYFYFLVERGEVEGLEDAYIQLNSPLGLPFDLMVGQFQVSDPMFKREARLERADYEIYRTRVGDAAANLTYDRGLVLGTDLPGGIETVFQVVNGNGIPHADDARHFDGDGLKNVALHLARMAGEARIGLFGYWGREESDAGPRNETWYVGPDVSIPLGRRAELNAQYLERRDDNPFFTDPAPTELETRGAFGELQVFPEGEDGRWVVTGLFNWVESDDDAAARRAATVTLNYLLARNVRLLVEAGRDIERERMIGVVGLVSAF